MGAEEPGLLIHNYYLLLLFATSTAAASTTAPKPRDTDFLMERGKRIQVHPGNFHIRTFLENDADEEYRISRRRKRSLTFCINMVLALSNPGCSFLQQQSPGVWIERVI